MRWPARIPAGQVCNEVITSMDLLPTIAYYCGANTPADRIIDGYNVSDILEGKQVKSPTETFYYYQRQQLQAVRWKNWKYHLDLDRRIIGPHGLDTEQSEGALYNLADDISESVNLVNKHPEIVVRMKEIIKKVRYDLGDWEFEGHNIRPAGFIDEPFPRLLKE